VRPPVPEPLAAARPRPPVPPPTGEAATRALPASENGAVARPDARFGRQAVSARVELEEHAGDSAELPHLAAATEHG
jgi:hypothetical protein